MGPCRQPPIHQGATLRKGRCSEIGRTYLITAVSRARTPLFVDLVPARAVIRELRNCDCAGFTHTLAFVLMPDHLHWLVRLEAGDLALAMRRLKSRSAIRINRLANTPGRPVWQAGYHDHALRRDEDLRAAARYVIANPIRAGLVASVRDYAHWDVAWL